MSGGDGLMNTPLGRSKAMTRPNRSEDAKRAIEEQRTKALWFMYRNEQMEAAMMLGLTPGPALVSEWREYIE